MLGASYIGGGGGRGATSYSYSFAVPPRPPCACETCRLTRALREANNALEALAEKSTERDMAACHLRSEVEAALASRRPIRRRLRRALDHQNKGTPAVHAEVPVMSPRTGSEAR